MSGVLQNIDRLGVVFDDGGLVADGGLLLAGTVMSRLGLEALVDDTVRLGARVGGANPGRKVLTLVASMLAGGSHVDHVDRLRAGSTGRVLPFRVMAPSTVGTFLRSFTWGHVRQLEKALTSATGRAWEAGAGPGEKDGLVLDLDSTVCEVSGKTKEGAAYGYTNVLGYHPLLAFRADTGEVVAARLREGSSQRGVVHFAKETIGRARRAGAGGPVTVRADSGFYSYDLFDAFDRAGVEWSVTAPRYSNILATISTIEETDWTTIDYPRGGIAQVAETTLTITKKRTTMKLRLVVRRTRVVGDQQQLWTDWRYHAFVTNLDQPTTEADRHHHNTVEADRQHRAHAVCELAIRDLKGSAGLAHLPSARFYANAAWLLCAALAHNLHRWVALLGKTQPDNQQLVVGTTIRTRLYRLPGRIVNHSRQHILRLPTHWPWARTYLTTLANLRNLPQLC